MVSQFLQRKKVPNRTKKKQKKCRKSKNLNVGPETTYPGAAKFQNNILLLQLVFEQEWFEPPIGFSYFFGLETQITRPIVSKICTKVVPYVPHSSSEFQGSTLGRFEVIAILASGCRKTKSPLKDIW